MSKGIINNNPLNIRKVAGTRWKGEKTLSNSPFKGENHNGFVHFESVAWGIRAACCLLRTYRDKYHLCCIRDIINRWAPPSENNTEQYIRNVCIWTGFGGLQRLTENDWPQLLQAMARQETGIEISREEIMKGIELYKVKSAQRLKGAPWL